MRGLIRYMQWRKCSNRSRISTVAFFKLSETKELGQKPNISSRRNIKVQDIKWIQKLSSFREISCKGWSKLSRSSSLG